MTLNSSGVKMHTGIPQLSTLMNKDIECVYMSTQMAQELAGEAM